MNILVSGASGVVGYGILKSLRAYNSEWRLVGTTVYARSAAPAFCDVCEIVPKTIDENYLESLTRLIRKHSLHLLIPGIEDDMIFWNQHRNEIMQAGAFPLLNTPELISLCADKWLFYKILMERTPEFAIPTSIQADKLPFNMPFLLKPMRGYGGRGIVKIEDEKSFEKHKGKVGTTHITQPIVGSDEEEFTVSAFFDKDSNLVDSLSMKRKLSSVGYTEIAETVFREDLDQAVFALAKAFSPVGPTNFQFRMDGNKPKLLEINPRISSATSIRAAFGYNESALAAEYFVNGKQVQAKQKQKGYAVRYVEEAVFYDSNSL
jgi:carbamoyl-phosphate synthase large subunit